MAKFSKREHRQRAHVPSNRLKRAQRADWHRARLHEVEKVTADEAEMELAALAEEERVSKQEALEEARIESELLDQEDD